MSSSRIGRLPFGNSNPSQSIYETIQQHDEDSSEPDVENRAAISVDEENLRHDFNEYELDEALEHASDVQSTHDGPGGRLKGRSEDKSRSRWKHLSHRAVADDDANDDVPASLLVEREGEEDSPLPPPPPLPRSRNHKRTNTQEAIPGPSNARTNDQLNTARSQQPLHASRPSRLPPTRHYSRFASIYPKEKALWRWANVENLDNFLKDVYVYFLENGIWCIVLSRALNLLYVPMFPLWLRNVLRQR